MSRDDAAATAGLFERAAEAADGVARSGWRLSIMPALALPQSLRSPLFDGFRWWSERAAQILPGPFGRTADRFAADLDDMEGRVARREDLGSRLRRERRRDARRD